VKPFVIESVAGSIPLEKHLSYFVDSTDHTLDQVIVEPFGSLPDPSLFANPKLFVWIKLALTNETNANQFVITLDQWSTVDFYIEEGNSWKEFHSGTLVPVKIRPISLHRLISFPVVIDPGESKLILMKVRVVKPLMQYYAKLFTFLTKVELDESSHAFKKYIQNQLIVLFIIGVLSILFIYNLSLYLFSSHGISLILSIYFILAGVSIANTHGIATNYLFKAAVGFEMLLALNLAHLMPIVIASFLFAFFRWKKKDWESYFLLFFAGFMVFSWIYSVSTNQSLFYFERRYLEYFIFLSVIISAIIKQKQGGITILIAILATILTGYFAEFKAVFFDDATFVGPDTPYLVGVLTQVIIFSVAATYRVRALQQDVEIITREKQELIENQNTELKKLVEQKTGQLQEALTTLQQKQEELINANETLKHNAEEIITQSSAITKLNSTLEDLVRERTAALRATARDLDTFLYRTSHDLRRPLMTILGLSNLISLEDDPQKIREMMRMIDLTVKDLDRMLKKLIGISLCYNESVDMELVSLHGIIASSMQKVSQEYQDKRFTMAFDAPSTEFRIQSNPYLLDLIITSILENAIIYGHDGVTVTATVVHSGSSCTITITDDGPGIESKFLPSVFEMFTRFNVKSNNGLGLYLVKLGVTKLKGEIVLESTFGSGTEVRLLFHK
jgi:signal transduction histidine kinase